MKNKSSDKTGMDSSKNSLLSKSIKTAIGMNGVLGGRYSQPTEIRKVTGTMQTAK